MAYRLIKLTSKVERILRNNGVNINIVAKVQVRPRFTKVKYFPRSNAKFSHEPPKTFDKPLRPNMGDNGGAKNMKGKETAEKNKTGKRPNKASSTTPPKSSSETQNQGSKSGGNGGGGQDRQKNYRVPVLDELATRIFVYFHCYKWLGMSMIFVFWLLNRGEIDEITLEDFVDNYLSQGRVVKAEFVGIEWILFKVPNALADGAAEIKAVRIDSLEYHELEALLDKLVEMTKENKSKVESENNIPDKGQNLEMTAEKKSKVEPENNTPDKGQSLEMTAEKKSKVESENNIPDKGENLEMTAGKKSKVESENNIPDKKQSLEMTKEKKSNVESENNTPEKGQNLEMTAEKKSKVDPENNILDIGLRIYVFLQVSLTIIQFLEYGWKAWRRFISRRLKKLIATISKMIFRK